MLFLIKVGKKMKFIIKIRLPIIKTDNLIDINIYLVLINFNKWY